MIFRVIFFSSIFSLSGCMISTSEREINIDQAVEILPWRMMRNYIRTDEGIHIDFYAQDKKSASVYPFVLDVCIRLSLNSSFKNVRFKAEKTELSVGGLNYQGRLAIADSEWRAAHADVNIVRGYRHCYPVAFDTDAPTGRFELRLGGVEMDGKTSPVPPVKFIAKPPSVKHICFIPFCFGH